MASAVTVPPLAIAGELIPLFLHTEVFAPVGFSIYIPSTNPIVRALTQSMNSYPLTVGADIATWSEFADKVAVAVAVVNALWK